ncbi:hypothetical protein Zmor_011597 [Zophobas morio]|uniref:Uncharacterized protein n=1 Tax=Zophobas morio TaxID=2755281 RepID=A0AA38IQD4_9CUCU|nr:hypothetical protein Zmor_011597 [Zophobas morio]
MAFNKIGHKIQNPPLNRASLKELLPISNAACLPMSVKLRLLPPSANPTHRAGWRPKTDAGILQLGAASLFVQVFGLVHFRSRSEPRTRCSSSNHTHIMGPERKTLEG